MNTATRLFGLALACLLPAAVSAHPGSGIAVDRHGQVYFVDTGAGVWKIDQQERLSRQPGPAYHWMALDPQGRYDERDMPGDTGGDLQVTGPDPTLIISSDYPVAVGSDGSFYYPQAGRDGRVRMMRLAPSGHPEPFATLPAATEADEDGRRQPAPWIHGLAAATDGALYYAERDAVRRIAPDGTVTAVAEGVRVPDCVALPAATRDHLRPSLRGLAVAGDGTVYVAASACCAVLKIAPGGEVTVVLRGEDAWSPTGVTLAGDELYVLEYRSIEATRREDWLPRVRKLSPDGKATVVAAVER